MIKVKVLRAVKKIGSHFILEFLLLPNPLAPTKPGSNENLLTITNNHRMERQVHIGQITGKR